MMSLGPVVVLALVVVLGLAASPSTSSEPKSPLDLSHQLSVLDELQKAGVLADADLLQVLIQAGLQVPLVENLQRAPITDPERVLGLNPLLRSPPPPDAVTAAFRAVLARHQETVAVSLLHVPLVDAVLSRHVDVAAIVLQEAVRDGFDRLATALLRRPWAASVVVAPHCDSTTAMVRAILRTARHISVVLVLLQVPGLDLGCAESGSEGRALFSDVPLVPVFFESLIRTRSESQLRAIVMTDRRHAARFLAALSARGGHNVGLRRLLQCAWIGDVVREPIDDAGRSVLGVACGTPNFDMIAMLLNVHGLDPGRVEAGGVVPFARIPHRADVLSELYSGEHVPATGLVRLVRTDLGVFFTHLLCLEQAGGAYLRTFLQSSSDWLVPLVRDGRYGHDQMTLLHMALQVDSVQLAAVFLQMPGVQAATPDVNGRPALAYSAADLGTLQALALALPVPLMTALLASDCDRVIALLLAAADTSTDSATVPFLLLHSNLGDVLCLPSPLAELDLVRRALCHGWYRAAERFLDALEVIHGAAALAQYAHRCSQDSVLTLILDRRSASVGLRDIDYAFVFGVAP